VSAPTSGIHAWALIGAPPEHRDFRGRFEDAVGYLTERGLEVRGVDAWRPWTPVIDQSALVEAFVSVDAGTERATRIGARAWLMKHVHIGHDAMVGADCELSPGAVVCGFAELGEGVRMGVNSCVRPFIRVGAGARIGMGAVVVKNVPAGEVWVGNPAGPIGVRQ
jgi:acyl-[acyl carrier protein]--UDP-N-acetylglucosamine O-acyltransferase